MTRIAFALAGCSRSVGPWGLQGDPEFDDRQRRADRRRQDRDSVTTIQSSSATNLTKAQAASCAGEALANTLTDMLTSTGHPNAAKTSADVSTALGDGCTWKLPAL